MNNRQQPPRSAVLAFAQVLAYLTLVRVIAAAITGNASSWRHALLWLAITGVAFAVVFFYNRSRRRAGDNQDAAAMRIENATLSLLRERPAFGAARLAFWICAFFALTSTAGTIFIDGRMWPVPVAYVTTALLAGVVILIERRREARRSATPDDARQPSA